MLMVLSVAALVLLSLAHFVHTPASKHENTLSLIVSGILLLLFVLTLPASLRRGGSEPADESMHQDPPRWPVALAVGLLALAAVLSAFVSDWFITFDGESNWIEGAALIAVYAIIATTFWWG